MYPVCSSRRVRGAYLPLAHDSLPMPAPAACKSAARLHLRLPVLHHFADAYAQSAHHTEEVGQLLAEELLAAECLHSLYAALGDKVSQPSPGDG